MSLRKQIAQAVTLYESFRERAPKRIGRISVPVPKAVTCIGYVEGIDYRTTHGNKPEYYHHTFAKGSRPLFAVSATGKQLLLIGGRFRFTERGIVDHDAKGREIENAGHGKRVNPRKRAAGETWHIEVENMHGTGGYERYTPMLDGAPRAPFKSRAEAEAYAYDYNIAGRRNGPLVRYVRDKKENPTAAQILDDSPPVAMTGFDGAPVKVGDSVEMHPATDQWKSGQRFGKVTKIVMGSPLTAHIRIGRQTIKADGIYFRLTRRTPLT